MSNQPGDLRLLLQLMGGSLPPADRTVLRERFASDRELRRRWDYLNNLPPLNADDALAAEETSIDQVAAFIDGTLPRAAAIRFEDQSWKSPAVLTELVNLTQSNGTRGVPEGLTSRLLSMVPDVPIASDSLSDAQSGIATNAITADISTVNSPSIDQPVIVATSEPNSFATPRRRKERRSRAIVFGVMAASFVAVLALLLWLGVNQESGKRVVQPEDPRSLVPDQNDQKIVDDRQQSPEPQSPDGPPHESVAPDVPDSAPPVLTPDQPKIVNVPEQPSPPKPKDDLVAPVKTIDWLEVKGLVAARLSVRDTWRGLDAKAIPVSGNYATFPLTRAIAKGPDAVELIIDQQTEFSELTWSDGIQLRIHQGRVALRNLRDDTRVRFLVNDETFELVTRRDRTTVSLDLGHGEPRIGVHGGVAVINKNKLEKDTFYLARQDRTGNVRNTAQHDKWLGTWQASVPIDPELLKTLRKSNNLRGDLVRLTRDNTLPKPTGDRLVFVVAPHARIHTLLQSRNHADQDAAVRWLLVHPTEGDNIEQTAWQNIRRALQNGGQRSVDPTITTMKKWLRGVRGEEAVNATELRRAMNLRQGILKNFAGACVRVSRAR